MVNRGAMKVLSSEIMTSLLRGTKKELVMASHAHITIAFTCRCMSSMELF